MAKNPSKARHGRAASTLLLLAAQSVGAQSYWYMFDACGFNSNGWQPSPQEATRQAKLRFDADRVATSGCPPGSYWQTAEVEPVALNDAGDWSFRFRITSHAITYYSDANGQRCDLQPPQIGEWTTCITMTKGVVLDRFFGPPAACCSDSGGAPALGNPIHPLSGHKTQVVRLARLGGFELNALYDSTWRLPNSTGSTLHLAQPPDSFGTLWGSTWHRRLALRRGADGTLRLVQAMRGGGRMESFQVDASGHAWPVSDTRDQLRQLGATTWRYIDAEANTLELYGADGQLLSLESMSGGGRLDFSYSDGVSNIAVAPFAGLLVRATDRFGRSLSFEYEPVNATTARIRRVLRHDGKALAVAYDVTGNLSIVTREDGRTVTLLYERGDLPWALTGMVDENQIRVSRYDYDASGLAMATGLADGGGTFTANRYTVSHVQPPRWLVQSPAYDAQADVLWRDHRFELPTGTTVATPEGTIALQWYSAGAFGRLASRLKPAGAGVGPTQSTTNFDDRGLVTAVDDFNGTRTCFGREARGFEHVRVEGLGGGVHCQGVIAEGAALPEGARKVSTQWHPLARLPSRVAEAGRITQFFHHGQPDPTLPGQSLASCAPASATLADGSPMPLLCRSVEAATTDTNGALGFAATSDTMVPQRIIIRTYDAAGRLLTQFDPQSGLTTLAYHAVASPSASRGDLQSVTNALGHVTQFLRYDRTGNVLEETDPNGVVTGYSYDDRQRLTGITVGDATRQFSYWGSGQLYRATEPDGSFVEFRYDAAQRLIAVLNSDGQRIDYTLDAAGRRLTETATDGTGTLRRQVARVYDALGRVERVTGRELRP